MFEDVQYFVCGLQFASISCIKEGGGGNMVTHVLAWYAKNIIDEMYWLEDSPPPVVDALFIIYVSMNEYFVFQKKKKKKLQSPNPPLNFVPCSTLETS